MSTEDEDAAVEAELPLLATGAAAAAAAAGEEERTDDDDDDAEDARGGGTARAGDSKSWPAKTTSITSKSPDGRALPRQARHKPARKQRGKNRETVKGGKKMEMKELLTIRHTYLSQDELD